MKKLAIKKWDELEDRVPAHAIVADVDALQLNEDGSVDLYFGEIAPGGKESNWIPTAGADFFLLFRLYGPEEAYFDKSFKLPDIEKLN